jgi:eukaryotic-like serine/threonine-protein kinase
MITTNQRIGEYVLQDRISAGTFGEVWRAHHHVWSDQIVAMKIPTDPQYIRNLQREGVTIHGLVHPNIVRALAFDPFAEIAYLAMEYVPGTSLRPVIQSKKLTPDQAVAIMRQVLAGLSYAHAAGVVHRDIKPENILMHERVAQDGYGASGLVKVTDFGLGQTSQTLTAGSIAYSASLQTPQAQEIVGTLDYMAPEQRGGAQTIDGRTDLYACGVVLYELLTGERPAGTELPSGLNPAVPKYLDEAFRRSYARIDKRFASADDFAKALGGPPSVPLATLTPPFRPAAAVVLAEKRACSHCRGPIEATDQFCMHCGVQLAENVRRCPQCGAYPDVSDQYCIFCGQTLGRAPVPIAR